MKIIFLVGFLVFVLIIILVIKTNFQKTNSRGNIPQTVPSSQASPSNVQQLPFQVLSTSPENNAADVPPTEITVSFTSSQPLRSANSFRIDFNPTLPYGLQNTTQFPASTIQARVLGGLEPSTTYTATIKNALGQEVYSWSFTTTEATGGLSSSALIEKQETSDTQKYLPLFNYVPYSSPDFNLDYTGDLTLQVQIKNPDVNKVKQEVNNWIKSKGVDPATHTINYVNDF